MALHDLWQSESEIGTGVYFTRSAEGSAMPGTFILMPIVYQRDDQRRLITVTVTEPWSVDDILSVIDRQAGEDTWEYALLYDLRALKEISAEIDLQQIADRVKAAGSGRERGGLGIAIPANPAIFLTGITYTNLTKGFVTVEVLLSAPQIDAWLFRNARSGSSRR
jgi:hypothetical protein